MNKYLSLFVSFLKIGAFTFGGGYAMIPLIHAEMVDKKKWITDEEMIDMLAIAEMTPGVIAVNSATYVGYKVGKFWGSFLATLGVILPSLFTIIIIALFFENFLAIKLVSDAFRGIRAGVTVLIFNTGFKMFKAMPKAAYAYLLFAVSLFFSLFVEFRYLSLCLIIFGAIVGIVIQIIKQQTRKDQK